MRVNWRKRSSVPGEQLVTGKSPLSTGVRLIIVGCTLIASMALALGLIVHAHSAAFADPVLLQTQVPTINNTLGADPWDIKINNGRIFVAEPQCDVNVNVFPVCTPPAHVSGIIEYSVAGFNNGAQPVNKLLEPAGYSSPFFLAFDGSGNLWFSEPVTNSIGEFDTGGSWHQWSVPTAGASPFDLTFDQFGHLWFTELTGNKIGEFDPASQLFNEYAPPTANSRPYGITGPDPSTHSIWFTENSGSVHRIGRITPNADGTVNGQIQEYLTNISCQSSNCITPHRITYDNAGNIWWSEGFDGNIGKLVISQAQNNASNGVTEYAVPAVPSSHISGIAVDSNGTVWFDDALSNRYGSFNPATNQFTMFTIAGTNPHPHDGLAVDCNNNVWISEEFSNTLAEAQTGAANNQPCGSPPPTPTPTTSPTPTGTPPPGLQAGPVNKTWYFAEGRVGGGFTEYLSLDNPTSTPCSVSITYLYTPDSGTPATKTVTVPVPANTRYEEGVDGDLGTSPGGHGISDSAIVTVGNSCPGIVAERPMYFTSQGNQLGVSSTSDVLGVTHLGTSFYLADVATGAQNSGSYASFLTILNPPGAPTASITVTYYLNGAAVGTDTATVNGGTRGTIWTSRHTPALPPHVAVVVTSSQPVAVERPTYFSHVSEGNAGVVSGGADVIAVQSLSPDWLFAEGYTGGQFQEQFVLANLDPNNTGTANVTIKLEPQNGAAPSIFTVQVPHLGQVIWDVNQHLPGQSLSAEITSSGPQIAVDREMFFRYNHQGNGRSLQATGGSDALGQVGPAAQSLYSFAEGYVNVNYDEWLTLQNPTGSSETIWVTLDNALGHTTTFYVLVSANSRSTVDIVHQVLTSLYHNGDGYKGMEVSMTVQTTSIAGGPFVAERPMYSNVGGVQGGTDIIGYTGS